MTHVLKLLNNSIQHFKRRCYVRGGEEMDIEFLLGFRARQACGCEQEAIVLIPFLRQIT